jgi:hypothetical protein
VLVANIDHRDRGIVEISEAGFAAMDGHIRLSEKDAAGEEIVFMGAAGVGNDCVKHELRDWRD